MNTHESDRSQEPTAPQQDAGTKQLDGPDSPARANRTGPQSGDTDTPGQSPDEITPAPGATDIPSAQPDEVGPTPGDTAQPGNSPDEFPS